MLRQRGRGRQHVCLACRPPARQLRSRSAAISTQPTGGKFDGNLAGARGAGALRTLVSAGYETNAPIVVVNWTNEEGARFAPAMLGSGVFAGVYSRAWPIPLPIGRASASGRRSDAIGWRSETKAGAPSLGLSGVAYRAGPHPGSGGKNHRGGHGRAGRALVASSSSMDTKATPARHRCRAAPMPCWPQRI